MLANPLHLGLRISDQVETAPQSRIDVCLARFPHRLPERMMATQSMLHPLHEFGHQACRRVVVNIPLACDDLRGAGIDPGSRQAEYPSVECLAKPRLTGAHNH